MLSDRVQLSFAEARVEEIKGRPVGVFELAQAGRSRHTYRTQVSLAFSEALSLLGFECSQHRQTLRPSVDGTRSKALRPIGSQ